MQNSINQATNEYEHGPELTFMIWDNEWIWVNWRMNEKMNEWMGEWMKEWLKKRKNEIKNER